METRACWFSELTALGYSPNNYMYKHVTNDSSGRNYECTVSANVKDGHLTLDTKFTRIYKSGYSPKAEAANPVMKLNWEYTLDASLARPDGTLIAEGTGKWSGVFFESPDGNYNVSHKRDNIENSVKMEGPSYRLGRWWETGSRGEFIGLKVTYQLKVTESVEKKVPAKLFNVNISPGLKHLVNKRNSDVVVKCGASQFDAHKLVLSCCSPVFSRMFASQLNEAITNCVTIDDFDVETVKDMISFMYEGMISSTSKESLVALLDCAEKYEISELKVLVLQKMVQSLSPENALEFAAASTKYGADENTKAKLFEYCKSNFQSLSTNEEFKKFFKENVDLFL